MFVINAALNENITKCSLKGTGIITRLLQAFKTVVYIMKSNIGGPIISAKFVECMKG
jgi:hypothetical protein